MAKKNSKLMIVFAAIALAAYGCRQFSSNETADTTNATTRSAESGHAEKPAQETAPAGNRDQEAYECPRWVRTGTAEQMLNRMGLHGVVQRRTPDAQLGGMGFDGSAHRRFL